MRVLTSLRSPLIRGKFLTLFIALLVAGCTEVRLLSEYDQFTDEHVSQLQTDFERLFTSLERRPQLPDCGYHAHADFYAETTVTLNVLIARNEVRPDNDISERQLKNLKSSLGELEQLHELSDEENRCLLLEEVGILRSAFTSSIGAILRLELAKKRGDEGH